MDECLKIINAFAETRSSLRQNPFIKKLIGLKNFLIKFVKIVNPQKTTISK